MYSKIVGNKIKESITCPISTGKSDVTVIRIIALLVVINCFLFTYLQSIVSFTLLGIDFSLRALSLAKFSPLKIIAGWIKAVLRLSSKPVNAGAKRFAAAIGAVFSLAIVLSIIIDLRMVQLALASLLGFCAFLEAAFNVCIGCYLYSFLLFIRRAVLINTNNEIKYGKN